VLRYACGDRDEDNVDFFVVDSHGAEYADGYVSYESFSSLGIKDSYLALKNKLDIQKIKVNLRRLDTILKTHAPDIHRIDIISVDVEGWELEVLSGLDILRYRPRVMIIENLFNSEEYRSYMKGIGYSLWRCVRPNDIYVRDKLTGFVRRFLSRS
jgi:FkbM family methyltransferase